MKQRHFFTFLCTILIPPGVLLGEAFGETLGFPLFAAAIGAAGGCLAAHLLVRYACERARDSTDHQRTISLHEPL